MADDTNLNLPTQGQVRNFLEDDFRLDAEVFTDSALGAGEAGHGGEMNRKFGAAAQVLGVAEDLRKGVEL